MAQVPKQDDTTQSTNPFTTSEIRQRLDLIGDSEKTNPFTSEEIRSRLLPMSPNRSGAGRSSPAAGAEGNTGTGTGSGGARLILTSAQPAITARLLEGNPTRFQLDFKAALPGRHVLAVAQEPGRIHVGIAVSDSDAAPRALAAIYFDPESDVVLLQNVGAATFAVTPPGVAVATTHLVPVVRKHAVAPGVWSLHVGAGASTWTHVVQVTVAPRSFFTLEGDDEDGAGEKGGAGARKRAAEDDGDEDLAATKRQRSGRDGVVVDIVFEPPAAASTLVPRNPLLNLKDGGTVTLKGTGGAVYTLTRARSIYQNPASKVFKATKSDVPGKFVAVKVFRIQLNSLATKDSLEHYESIARACRAMEREIQIHKGLKHDRIVELYSVDSRLMTLYLEYVEGPSLAHQSWCTRLGFMFQGTTEDAWTILTDLSRGLAFLHSRGIVHNDLKPANVLYSRERGAVICDLGLASVVKKTRGYGSPWYVGPENLNPAHLRVAADDCWSLGIIALFALEVIALPDATFEGWQISQMASNGSTAEAAAIRWYDMVKAIRRELDTPDQGARLVLIGGAGTELASRGDARRGRLVQFLLRLTEQDPTKRPTAEVVLEMLVEQ